MSAAGCHPARAGCGRAGGAGHVPPEGTAALRDILHGGDDVLGSGNSKEPLNRPRALCSLFSALLSLPPPAFCCFLRLALTRVPSSQPSPMGTAPFRGWRGFLQTRGCGVEKLWCRIFLARGRGEVSFPLEAQNHPVVAFLWGIGVGTVGDWNVSGAGGV